MNVSALIKRLKGKNYTVTRVNANGTYSTEDGTFNPGSTTTLTIMGSVQPATAEDLLSIPEGDRTRTRYRFYSDPPLKIQDTAALRKGDLVELTDGSYEVESLKTWPTHTLAIIAKVNTDEN